ncbi:MAG: T9SS type A sorting domain-containing protein [Bacteroidia bacterium]|jgi:hypothetical protein|nr:T9SS type A sorting domain-containing protein [Bacteroidia bacterium]
MKSNLPVLNENGTLYVLSTAGAGKRSGLFTGLKRFFYSMMFVALFVQGNAQNFAIIGTGNGSNSSTGYPAPFGNWYWGAKHQMFVTAAELTAAGITGGAMISSLGFNVLNTNGGPAHINFTIRVFTTVSADPLVSAYVNTAPVAVTTPSTVAPTLGWIMIPFVTPFNWNGTDNLVVETCFNNSSYITNFSTEWQSNLVGSTIKTRWNNQDDPNACTAPSFLQTSSTTRPLMRLEWVPGVPCAGTPSSNTVVVTPTSAICPNSTAGLSFASSYTVGGLTYQWQYSNVSAVGPWTTIPSGTLSSITSPSLNTSHFFSAIVTCTNSNSSITTAAGTVQVQNTTTNTVPYFEGFEGIPLTNSLPNCSWAASNINGTCFTYTNVQNQNRSPRTGQSYAAFGRTPAADNYFWTNQIWMEAGVTYSANVYYKTEATGALTWQLNLRLNTTQNPVGSTVIATTGGSGSAAGASYVLLSNTFTVGSTGFYNVGINGVSNGVCCANFLSWDDLEITVPCQLNPIAMNVSASSQTICQGQSTNISATGADTYLWNNGSTNANISVSPLFSTMYTVVGTNAITGCTTALSQNIVVNETPIVSALTYDPEICVGKSTNLQAFGATSYAWSNNATGAVISVSPLTNTTYTVIGSNAAGCSGNAVVTVTVNPLPVITVNSTAFNDLACPEDVTTLTGANAVTYQWSTPSSLLLGNPVNVSPNSSTTYSVIGTNSKGCEGSTTYVLNVTECVGLKDVSTTASGVKLYPNPNHGDFVIEIHNKKVNAVEVTDLTGRVLINLASSNEKINIEMSNFANGVYYVKISSDNTTEVIKVVKN